MRVKTLLDIWLCFYYFQIQVIIAFTIRWLIAWSRDLEFIGGSWIHVTGLKRLSIQYDIDCTTPMDEPNAVYNFFRLSYIPRSLVLIIADDDGPSDDNPRVLPFFLMKIWVRDGFLWNGKKLHNLNIKFLFFVLSFGYWTF